MDFASLLQRGKPPAKPYVYVAAGIAAISLVSGWVGEFLLAYLDGNELWLMILSPRNRNLILVANDIDAATFYLVGFLRLIFSDPANYLLGYWFGDKALAWVKRKSRTYGPLVDEGAAGFSKVAAPIIFLAPNNIVCALAGATGVKVRTFFAMNILGTITRLILIRQVGDVLESPIEGVRDWMSDNRMWVLIFFGASLAWTLFGEFRGDNTELSMLKDLTKDEEEPESE